ncbi:Smr/MutS family protein [Thiomicrorhabdus sp.]|uniref:Smr/MutS family protein n=1 Tax=Thiomicrorhabdus sp. TaxID=2039724 RepID=UPI003563AF29
MSKLSAEDKSLFTEAMDGVKPLNQKSKVSQQQSGLQRVRYHQTIKGIKQKQRQVELTVDVIENHDGSSTVGAFESLLYHRKGLRLQDLSRLKKGEFPIEAELDLHGLTEQAADETLQAFIHRCYHAHKRSVLVIHGKGYNSETDAPVLKNLANMRLRQLKQVIAFCSTQPKDGGTGSVYVLLKAH